MSAIAGGSRSIMNFEWISEKGASLISFVIALALFALSFIHSQHRYFYLVVTLFALVYGWKQFKRRITPFEKHERDIRRKTL
jgi:4-hydroxybenzoate polyprenyltransferase